MTFSLRRKLPTTAACATVPPRPTATKTGARFFFAAASLWWAAPALAQTQEIALPQFKTVNYAQAPNERTDARVEPDAPRTIIRVGGQLQSKYNLGDDDSGISIRTDLPGPDRMFDSRKSESMMREYIKRSSEFRTGPNRILFPESRPVSNEKYAGRNFPRSTTTVEPSYVCHGRLSFEQPNFERAGWDFGALTPGLNLAGFYYDVFMLPYHTWTNPCVRYDCSAGKCLPGDSSPFYLYREPISVSGLAAQSLAVGGGFFVFP